MANNQAKKVLIFSTAYLPLVGGAEIAVNEIAKRLPNWQFDLITAKIQKGLKQKEKINNINIYRVGFGFNFDKYLLPFLGLIKAKKLEKKNNYNLTWSIMASFGGFLGLRFKKKYPNKPWLLTLQEGDDPKYILKRVGIFKYWFKQIFEKADYFQAISSFLYNWAIKNGSKVGEIIPNGVDLEIFKPKEKINNKSEKIILTVSRLVKKNGVDDLIKAGQYLDFPFKIIIIGIGPDEEKLKKLAKDLKIQDKVMFQGQVKYNELPKYYTLADVFVRPSLSEGLGNVFLEAMACELLVIGTEIGGIPDFLKDPSTSSGQATGLFCKTNNPQNIAEKIKEILRDDNLRKYLAKNGLELVREKYSWDKIASQMENIYLKLVNEK